ncbi:MAG: carbon-nitrogen hydrolase family protein [Lentisphaerae bacterium]|nr:carbon-nitrogen hydrolase family protein [Lentisphaerota bacterium]
MTPLKILCLPYNTIEGDSAANVDGALRIIADQVQARKPDLVMLPELFTCGYCDLNLASYAESVDGPTMRKFRHCSEALGVWIGYGFAETHDAKHVYNSWALIGPKGELQVFRKTHLHPWEPGTAFNETDFLIAGDTLEPYAAGFATVGVMICYDGCFVEVARTLVLKGAELILWPSRSGGYLASQSLPRVRALDNTVPVVQVEGGQTGPHSPLKSWSLSASATGEVLVSQQDSDQPFRVRADCEEGRRLRESNDRGGHSLYQPRRPELYGAITQRVPQPTPLSN